MAGPALWVTKVRSPPYLLGSGRVSKRSSWWERKRQERRENGIYPSPTPMEPPYLGEHCMWAAAWGQGSLPRVPGPHLPCTMTLTSPPPGF